MKMNSIRARTGVDSFRGGGVLKDERSLPPPRSGIVPEVLKEGTESGVRVQGAIVG